MKNSWIGRSYLRVVFKAKEKRDQFRFPYGTKWYSFWDDSHTYSSKKHRWYRNVGRMSGKERCGSLEVRIYQYNKWMKRNSIFSRHSSVRLLLLSFPYTTMQVSVYDIRFRNDSGRKWRVQVHLPSEQRYLISPRRTRLCQELTTTVWNRRSQLGMVVVIETGGERWCVVDPVASKTKRIPRLKQRFIYLFT